MLTGFIALISLTLSAETEAKPRQVKWAEKQLEYCNRQIDRTLAELPNDSVLPRSIDTGDLLMLLILLLLAVDGEEEDSLSVLLTAAAFLLS